MILECLEVSPFMENAYIVGCEQTREAAVFDPGDEADRIIAAASRLELKITQIIATHAHIDHIGAVQDIKQKLGVPFKLHKNEEILVKAYDQQCRMFGIRFGAEPGIDTFIEEGDEVRIGNLTARALLTPGHSPGGLSFLFEGSPNRIIVGDTLFMASIGRTDLIGGDLHTLINNIKNKILSLPDDTEVYSGHGPMTTVGKEKRFNPFLNMI